MRSAMTLRALIRKIQQRSRDRRIWLRKLQLKRKKNRKD